LGRPNVHWLDAGETATLKYGCFLLDGSEGTAGIQSVEVSDSEITVQPKALGAHGDAKTMRMALSGGARLFG
jgi:hypothetical protein